MTFWATLLALAWDQLSPLHRPSQFERLFGRYADWVREHFNAGTRAHGFLAWAAAALLPALAAGLAGVGLSGLWSLPGLAWGAASLYYCLGFRQSADVMRGIAADLRGGDVERVRHRYAELGLAVTAEMAADELSRLAIGEVLRRALARLFGALFWFVLLGAFGAVTYALTRLLAERWRGEAALHAAVARVVEVLDWLPARLLALSFAIVGNFDEAMLAWRGNADLGESRNEGIARAAGFGALGLGHVTPGPDYVNGAVSLVARAALLWLAVLGIFWLGGL